MKNEYLISLSSDYQSGATVGLMMPGPEQLPDGGQHFPSPQQGMLSDQYIECVEKEAEMRRGKTLIEIFNGDATEDGRVFKAEQIVSPNTEVHKNIFRKSFDYRLRKVRHNKSKGDLLYFVGGTGAHVGNSFQHENSLAKDFYAIPFLKPTDPDGDDGWFVWDHLIMTVNGILFDIAHQGAGVGRRPWTWENSLYNTIKGVYFECLEMGLPVPRYWIRAHNHRYTKATYYGKTATITGIIMPCFELRSHHITKVSGAQTIADIGQIYIDVGKDGKHQLHEKVKRIAERRLPGMIQVIR